MLRLQKELVQERVSNVAIGLACHAGDTADDQRAWAACLLLTATRDLEAPERRAVRQGVGAVLRMLGFAQGA